MLPGRAVAGPDDSYRRRRRVRYPRAGRSSGRVVLGLGCTVGELLAQRVPLVLVQLPAGQLVGDLRGGHGRPQVVSVQLERVAQRLGQELGECGGDGVSHRRADVDPRLVAMVFAVGARASR